MRQRVADNAVVRLFDVGTAVRHGGYFADLNGEFALPDGELSCNIAERVILRREPCGQNIEGTACRGACGIAAEIAEAESAFVKFAALYEPFARFAVDEAGNPDGKISVRYGIAVYDAVRVRRDRKRGGRDGKHAPFPDASALAVPGNGIVVSLFRTVERADDSVFVDGTGFRNFRRQGEDIRFFIPVRIAADGIGQKQRHIGQAFVPVGAGNVVNGNGDGALRDRILLRILFGKDIVFQQVILFRKFRAEGVRTCIPERFEPGFSVRPKGFRHEDGKRNDGGALGIVVADGDIFRGNGMRFSVVDAPLRIRRHDTVHFPDDAHLSCDNGDRSIRIRRADKVIVRNPGADEVFAHVDGNTVKFHRPCAAFILREVIEFDILCGNACRADFGNGVFNGEAVVHDVAARIAADDDGNRLLADAVDRIVEVRNFPGAFDARQALKGYAVVGFVQIFAADIVRALRGLRPDREPRIPRAVFGRRNINADNFGYAAAFVHRPFRDGISGFVVFGIGNIRRLAEGDALRIDVHGEFALHDGERARLFELNCVVVGRDIIRFEDEYRAGRRFPCAVNGIG